MAQQAVTNVDQTVNELTREQVEFYRENGYIGVNDVISKSELAELNSVIDEFIERSRKETKNSDMFDLEPGHTAEVPLVARIRRPQDFHEVFRRALAHSGVLDIVSQLVGEDVYYQGGKVNIKPAGVGSGFEWHQDWVAFPHTNDDVVAVGMALEDSLLDNGCLLVIPGSHKEPLYDHTQDGYHILAVSPVGLTERSVPIELRAGGISLHHARTLHASAPNRSSRSRRMLLYEYTAGDAWPLVQGPDDTWDALRERTLRGNGLSNHPRMEKLPVTLPFPKRPSDKGGSAIFDDHRNIKQSAFSNY